MNRSMMILLVLNLMLSTMIVVSSYHWFSIWVGLEMNTLSILPLLCYQFTPRSVESTMKYFLVQSFSAAMMLKVALIQAWLYSSWDMNHTLNLFTSSVLTLAISLKLGLFPCHYWFPDVVQGVSFLQGLLLSTWQKMAPFMILVSVSNNLKSYILVVMSVCSVVVGGWGGLKQTQVRKILAFSSISNMGWMCSVMAYSTSMSMVMMMMYLILKTSAFLMSKELKMFSLSSFSHLMYYKSWMGILLILVMLSLGGLPPLVGFLQKFLALQCLIKNGSFVTASVLILGSLFSLFFYLRMSFNSSLCLFPHHSLSVFSWRKVTFLSSKVSVSSMFLSSLVSFSVFGLVSFSLLVSMMK